ncbi:MAG: UDP-glucose/GDP-mannose dehydrogenase family protein [Thermodesulfobacteriota bacterium]|nr:UDP-glucose/GDP-mannose dehydrogenase family protein [Thermodesulfobacteriota bacterium]
MKICMIGAGYVGLVTGACLAEMGNDVLCVDEDKKRIAALKKGTLPIYEPGLKDTIERNVREGRLIFTKDIEDGIIKSLLCFIAVGTPSDADGSADLKYVLGVASKIGDILKEYKIIVNKSTVPVGTAEKVRDTIQKRLSQRGLAHIEFDVVSNPEFLKEGNAIQDFIRPERIIVGADNVRTAEIMKELYSPFVRTTNNPILIMDLKSAELSKYASNAFLATKISFINELAILCEKVGADISQVREGMGTDSRIGPRFLLAGPGYGGSCLPKDVKALLQTSKNHGLTLEICGATHKANKRQKTFFAEKIIAYFKDKDIDLSSINIAVWGLTFKPKTDDIREAPAIDIIQMLLDRGIHVTAFDPLGIDKTRDLLGDSISYAKDNYTALKDADALAVITEWNMFKAPDLKMMKQLMRKPVIFDGRNIYNATEMKSLGFTYFGIGRS